MGFNTTVYVANDGIGNIEDDAEFGRKLAAAIRENAGSGKPVEIDAVSKRHGSMTPAAIVLGQAHASYPQYWRVGGNTGANIATDPSDADLAAMARILERHGYTVKARGPSRSTDRAGSIG